MSAQLAPPADPSLAAYQLDIQREDWGDLLAPFSPPLPARGQIFLFSVFGDVCLEAEDGQVWWVNPHHRRVDIVAPSRAAFVERLGGEHVALVKSALVDMLIANGQHLRPGHVYGLKTPLSDGGAWRPDNVGASPIADAFAYWGAEFRRLSPAPAAAAKPTRKSWTF